MLFPTSGPSSLPIVVTQPDKRHANRASSVLSGMTDTEHSTTSSSNEKEVWEPLHYSISNKDLVINVEKVKQGYDSDNISTN